MRRRTALRLLLTLAGPTTWFPAQARELVSCASCRGLDASAKAGCLNCRDQAPDSPPPSPYAAQTGDPSFAVGGVVLTKSQVFRFIPVTLPLPTIRVTSLYGIRRDPIAGFSAMHSGVDFGAPLGSPIFATAAGRVVFAGAEGGYGNLVRVQHPFGFETRYAHLSRIMVAEGQVVDRDMVLGLTGASGRATGPHLHYEVRRFEVATDPIGFILQAYNVYHHLQ